MKKITCTISYFLLTVSLFSGCANTPRELTPINISFQKWVGYGPFYLAYEKGFFEKEGIKPFFVDEQLDSARRDAFRSGMLDCEAATLDLLVSKVAQDVPLTTVMEIDASHGGDAIIADADIKKLEDLAGKRVALARDDVGETFLSSLFYKKVLLFGSMTIVSVRPEEAAKTFTSGDADACVTWEPYVSEALKKKGAHILADTKEYPNIIIDTLNVRRDLLKNNPNLVKKLMRGWFRAVKYYNEHPLESSAIIAKYYNISPEEYRKQAAGLKWYDYGEQKTNQEHKDLSDAIRLLIEVKLANGRIAKRIDTSQLVDTKLMEKLYEDSK